MTSFAVESPAFAGMTIKRIVLLIACVTSTALQAQTLRTLDRFDDLTAWQAQHTDDISASLHAEKSADGNAAMRLDFDFADAKGNAVNGYATAHRSLPLALPDNYEISFRVRGDAPVNTLQFKLIDTSGENVWWINRADFEFAHEWQQIRIKKRQLEFAWGPSKDHELKHSAAVEFVVSSGRDGGKGSVYFDQLSLRELPAVAATPPQPSLSASSALKDAPAAAAMDGDLQSAWRSDLAKGPQQQLDIDLKQPREFGGLVLHWRKGEAATNYQLQQSMDGKHWHSHGSLTVRDGDDDYALHTESEARYLRLVLRAGEARSYGLKEIEIKDLAWGGTQNAFFQNVAKAVARGNYPRGFTEQSYWTIVGVDGGAAPALISEDGAIEPHKGGFSIEPFLIVDDKPLSWADVTSTQSLLEGYLPMPGVEWKSEKVNLRIDTFARGTRDAAQLIARYRVRNTTDAPIEVTLQLAIRPFQVNPPAQFLNSPGGVSGISGLKWNGTAVQIGGAAQVWPLHKPDGFLAVDGSSGWLENLLPDSQRPNLNGAMDDAFGRAAAALVYKLSLPAHAEKGITILAPISAALEPPNLDGLDASAWFERERAAVAAAWRSKLDRVKLSVPPQAQRIADSLRTALAHILITREDPALRPGTRSYARSWIRDGAMMADALLRMGEIDAARDYVDWYAPHQFANGKVPCCVDHRGSDPVPENDSHGELIHAIAQLYRYGGDRAALGRAQLEQHWPQIEAAIGYMDVLRASEKGDSNRAFKGLMPASISHEGYSAKPMHSYWDDFWALTGYKDAAEMAQVLGKSAAAARIARARDEFRADLLASIALAVKQRAIDFIPGCAELGDFDATSTTIALSPAGEQANLPQDLLHNTFEHYWRDFVVRSGGAKAWIDYTPYEWRTVGSFVRLGWRDRAQAAIDFFFASGARPPGWNQWAEVVGRDAREIRFIGDMPHGWIASDFIRSALDLFAYERDADHALVLAAGVPADWLPDAGIAVENLLTPYGNLNYTLQQNAKNVVLHIAIGAKPPGGFVLAWPFPGRPGATRIDGKRAVWQNAELRIRAAPAQVVIDLADKS
jgi:hypothetical protein